MQTNNSNPQSISFTFDMPDFSQMSDLVPPSTVHVQNASELAKKESRKIYRQSTRDPLSHRVIEKRRRDRMNTSLMRLSELIPQSYFNANTQTSRGRIEKTEIIEMAIKYLKDLKVLAEPLLGGEVGPLGPLNNSNPNEQNSSITLWDSNSLEHDELFLHCNDRSSQTLLIKDRFHYFRLGFQYCVNESLRFMLDSGEEEAARVRFSEELNEFGRKIDVDVITKHMLDSDRMKAYSKTLLEIEKDCKVNQITNIPPAMTIDARLNGSEFQPPRTTSTVTLSSNACAATVTSFPQFEQYNPTYPDPKTIYNNNLNSIQSVLQPSPTQPKFSSTSINTTPIDFSIKNLVPEIELLNVESVQSQPLKPKFNFDFHSINQNNEINIPKRIIDNPIDVIYNPKKNFKEKFLFQESSESSSNSSFLDSGAKAKLNEFSSSMIKLRNDVPTVSKESKNKDIFEKGKKFVPVFALHPSGRYYVPLEIESTILGMVDTDPQIQYSDNSAGSLSSPEEQPTQMSDVGWLKRRSSGGNDSESTESIQSWDNELHEVTKRPRYYPIGITVNLAFHQTISLASLKGKLSDIFSSFLNPTIPSGFQLTFQ